MDNILKKQLRQYVNHYEMFGDRSSLIMASMIMTILLNKDIDDELVDDIYVNID